MVAYSTQRQQRKQNGTASGLSSFQTMRKIKGAAQTAPAQLPTFMRSHWRCLGSLLFFSGACALILYAEIVRGWNEALFLKVRKDAVLTTCEPQEKYDTQLVYVSCPVVYMHDFRNQLAATFLRNIAPGRDLSGLSIELQTEIYQWREIAHCGGCEPQFQDANGNCVSGHRFASCRYTFEKAWVHEPLPSSGFACAGDGQRCEFPPGGITSVRNVGSIPPSLKSFKKAAESVSIGTNPGRYYLSPELIAQMPSHTVPLYFPKDDLPTIPGMTTSLVNSHVNTNVHQELRLERIPGSLDPSIGDVRSRVSMTDFDSKDSDRTVSAVAMQGSYIHGSRHRTLILWDSGISSWENGTDARVGWLREGDVSLDSIISEERAVVLKGVSTTILVCRLCGFACIFVGILLIFGPLAKVWADKRSRTDPSAVLRDVCLVFTIFAVLALVPACMFAAFPWLHFWPLCGGVLLAVAAFLCIVVASMLRVLDNWANLQTAMLEWRGTGAKAPCDDSSIPRTSLVEECSQQDDERGVLQEDVMSFKSRQSVKDYGAAGESSGYVP